MATWSGSRTSSKVAVQRPAPGAARLIKTPRVDPQQALGVGPLHRRGFGHELGGAAVKAPRSRVVVQRVVIPPDELHGPAVLALHEEHDIAHRARLVLAPLGEVRVQY